MTVIADAIIIGSGALGCATAFALVEAGVRRVAVVDRGPLVSGMTRRSPGLVHTYQSNAATARFASEGLELYRHWAAAIGGTCGYVESGTVVTADDDESARALQEHTRRQRDLGIDSGIVGLDRLSSMFPHTQFARLKQAAYEPSSGYVDAVLASQGLARKAREKGARFETGSLVKQIRLERGRITGIETTTGSLQAPVVIIAAGAGAASLLMPLGFAVNLRSTRGIIGFFEQPPELRQDGHPTVIDAREKTFLRPHAFHLSAVGLSEDAAPARPDVLEETVGGSQKEALAALAARRVPLLANADLKRAHAILYDRLSDGLPGLGRVPGVEGLYLMVGFGAASVAVAPGAGRAMAQLVADGSSGANGQELGLDRPSITKPRLYAD